MKTFLKLSLPWIIVAMATFAIGWWIGHPAETGDSASSSDNQPSSLWTCSMHPQIQQPDPGLCPICNMDLIPMNAAGNTGPREVMLSENDAAALNFRITPVLRRPAARELSLVGNITADERSLATVTARMSGRIERLFVDYEGISIRKGDHLAEIYSPEILVAEQELIQAKRALDQVNDQSSPSLSRTRQSLYRAAREKLRLLELLPEQIDAIEAQETPSDRITIQAPQAGIVTQLTVREGDYVKTGQLLFKVADLSTVWVQLEAYEQDLPWLRFAQTVEFTTSAVPGETFQGRVAFIDPLLNPATRTAKIRVNVSNEKGLLKPGLFVNAKVKSSLVNGGATLSPDLQGKWISPMHPEIIKDSPGQCDICGMDLVPAEELGFRFNADPTSDPLLVPASAVLHTGKRAVVYRRIESETADHLKFQGTTITLGARAGDYYVVENGLNEGDFVVTKGAFKLDSELQIQGKESMMSMPASYAGPPTPSQPLSPAELEKFEHALAQYLTLSHALSHDLEAEIDASAKSLVKALEESGLATLRPAVEALRDQQGRAAITAALPTVTVALAEITQQRAAAQLESPIFLLHCPMALDGKGADWLSQTREIENPYFGSEMFACGEVKSQLTVRAKPASSKPSNLHNHE